MSHSLATEFRSAGFRVIVANDSATVAGGAQKVAILSALGLARAGVPTTVFVAEGELVPEARDEPNLSLRTLGWEPEPPTTARTIRNSWNQAAYDAMRDEIARGREIGCDPSRTIVHLHLWAVTLSPSVVVAAQDAGAHVIVSLHDYHAACPQGQFFDVRANAICLRKPGGAACVTRHCHASRTWLGKAAHLYRWRVQRGRGGLPTRVRHFGVLSEGSEAILRSYLPPDARLHRLRNPILAERLPRVEAERNAAFAHSGRVSREKNPRLVAEAAARVGVPARFIGDGPLRAEIEALGLPDVTFSGWVDAAGIAVELAQARALVLSSVWYEVSPLAPLEALARGIPVLASSVTTSASDIRDGETGFVFRSGDVEDLAAKMRLLGDDALCERMSRAAYEGFWADPPTAERHIEDLLRVYDEMLSEAPARAAA